jgi:hypothetical protein
VALGLLALSLGVLLAILNTGSELDTDGIGEEFRTSVPQENATAPLLQKMPPNPPPAVDSAARKDAVIPFVIEWARSMRELDLERHVSSYAPVVDPFFTKRSVPLTEVRKEKERLFGGISEVRRLGVRDIRIESFQPERAVVTFRKDWDLRGRLGTAGAERQRLTLRWIDGRWRITAEQETTIYWTRKPRSSKGD